MKDQSKYNSHSNTKGNDLPKGEKNSFNILGLVTDKAFPQTKQIMSKQFKECAANYMIRNVKKIWKNIIQG